MSRRALCWWLAGLLGTTLVVVLIGAGGPGTLVDLAVYRSGGASWLHGVPLYTKEFPSSLPFTYPPVSAVSFSMLAMVPWAVAITMLTVAGLVALTASTVLAVPARVAGPVAVAVAAGAFAIEPVRSTLTFGQVNLVLMGLVAVDCLLPKTRYPRGLLIGIAAAIKLTPAIFVVFFLARRQHERSLRSESSTLRTAPSPRRAPVERSLRSVPAPRSGRGGVLPPVATATVTFVGVTGLGMLVAPADSVAYWNAAVFDPDRVGGVGFATNQSVRGALRRLELSPGLEQAGWLLLAAAVLVLAWHGARRAHRAGDQVVALLVVAAAGLVVSPVSWSHHWVWIVPAIAVCAVRARAALLIVTPFLVGHLFLPHAEHREMAWTWWQHVAGNSYLLAALGFLVWSVTAERSVRSLSGVGNVGVLSRA